MNPRPHFCADLHLHTHHSDGAFSPEELVTNACRAGLAAIAITDHDSVAGIAPARLAAGGNGPEIIAGVEFGTPADDTNLPEAHIVGLFVDDHDPELRGAIAQWRALRRERVVHICAKLNRLGVTVRPDEVFTLAGNASVGRLHVARVLVDNGAAANINAAFRQWLGADGPAYVPRQCASGADLVALIHRTGGVAVLAHPKLNVTDEEIPRFAAVRIDAIEVYSPEHSAADEQHYLDLAAELGLLVAGGSDCHGENKFRAVLGSVRLDKSRLEALRQRAAQYAEGDRHA